MNKIRTIITACALCVPAAATANAHVMLKEDNAEAGSRFAAVFVLPERCGESRTTALRITIPAGIQIAKPTAKPGWRMEVVEEPLAQPVTVAGERVSKRTKEVAWTIAAPRPAYDDTFALSLALPPTAGMLYFPAVQACESGERRWVEIPPPGKSSSDLKRPAPALMLKTKP